MGGDQVNIHEVCSALFNLDYLLAQFRLRPLCLCVLLHLKQMQDNIGLHLEFYLLATSMVISTCDSMLSTGLYSPMSRASVSHFGRSGNLNLVDSNPGRVKPKSLRLKCVTS